MAELNEVFKPELQNATNPKFGHYQVNNIMKISKLMKTLAIEGDSSPKALSDRLVASFEQLNSPLLSKIAGAAVFVNLTLSDSFLV